MASSDGSVIPWERQKDKSYEIICIQYDNSRFTTHMFNIRFLNNEPPV